MGSFDKLCMTACWPKFATPFVQHKKNNCTCSKRIYYFCRLEYEILGEISTFKASGSKKKKCIGRPGRHGSFLQEICPCSHLQVL